MDLLHKRYASPWAFMDGMIQTCRFREFVMEFLRTVNEEQEEQTEWEFYLHKVWEGTFSDFKASIDTNKQNQQMSERTIEATIMNSMDILKNFNPDQTGGES